MKLSYRHHQQKLHEQLFLKMLDTYRHMLDTICLRSFPEDTASQKELYDEIVSHLWEVHERLVPPRLFARALSVSPTFHLSDGTEVEVVDIPRDKAEHTGSSSPPATVDQLLLSRSRLVYTIARNKAIDHYRRYRCRRSLLSVGDVDNVVLPDDERKEQTALLYSIIDSLPSEDKTLVEHHLDGLSNKTIADLTGMSLRTVERHLNRIISSIVEQTKRQYYEE